jgi:WD40 repeat protein
VAASPALNLFVFVQAAGRESRLTVWSPDMPDARTSWTVPDTVKSVSFDQAQSSVAVLLARGELIVHSLQSGADTPEFGIREMAPSVAAFVPNTNLLVTAGNRWVRVWDVGQQRLRWSVWTDAAPWKDAPAEQIVASPDGRVVAVSVANTVRVWRVSDGSLLAEQATPGVIRELALSMNGARLVTVDQQSNVIFWQLDRI